MNITPVVVLFGSLILLAYTNMLLMNKDDQEKLWTNNGRNSLSDKKLYQFMICLSIISGIYLMYYLCQHPINTIRYSGIILFLSFSLLWAIFPFTFSKPVLFMVCIGLAIILSTLNMSTDKIAIVATIILLIQTFIFDFLLWTGIL
jgi:hypothetical protein